MFKSHLNLRILLEVSAVTLISIVLVHTLFYFVQRTHADSVERSIQTILRNEVNVTEPYRVAESLTDLESLGILRCSVLRNPGEERIFQDLRFKRSTLECNPRFFSLDGLSREIKPRGINGQIWSISFISSNSESFYILLWIARIFTVIASVLIYTITRRYLHSRVQQAELKEKIAAGVAHDIRSPLFALESALPDIEELPEDTRLLLQSATRRIRDIANDLLSKRAGRGVCRIAPLISTVVTEKRLEYRTEAGVEIRELVKGLTDDLSANVDQAQFQRVLSNLINNGVEALTGGGVVTVSAEVMNPGEILIRIADTGKGIPKELIAKLLNQGGSYNKNGSGIGLSSSISAVKNWGGNLGIDSEPGKGTSIWIRLPRSINPMK